MSGIDVTDLFIDPDVGGNGFWVIRREQVVNNHGVARTVDRKLYAVGSVYPTGKNSMVREEAYTYQANSYTVVTQFRLRGVSKDAGKQYEPDIIEWNGTRIVVKTVNDYTNYGAGFIEAECMSIVHVDTAPQPNPLPPMRMAFNDPRNSGMIGVLPCC